VADTAFCFKRWLYNFLSNVTYWSSHREAGGPVRNNQTGKYELCPAVKKLCQLRPELSASRDAFRPELSSPNMTSCVPRLVKNCISCIESNGCTKYPTIGRLLYSFIVFYFIHNYMHTYRIVEWYRKHSCYIILLSNVHILLKKIFWGKKTGTLCS